jgi:osmoprotectant transport system ATP-binding protein
MIVLRDLCKSFDGGKSYAVNPLSLDVADGETLVLLGSSGSGKTTTLKMINRLIEPTAGSIEIGDRDASRLSPIDLRRSIGYVFQGIGLFPHFSVEHNVSIIPRLLGWDAHRRRQSAHELLELIGLDPLTYADRYPDELSGGEQQRVGVARALAADPEYLLMDEPFGALDAVTRDALQTELLTWKRQLGKTILFVTHDLFEALALGDRIGVMHQGRLEQVGAPKELLHEPASAFVRDLFAKPAQQLAAFRDIL